MSDQLSATPPRGLNEWNGQGVTRRSGRLTAVFALVVSIMLTFGAKPGAAQPQPHPQAHPQARAHVYLLRGLMNVFSLGMDELAEELKRRGVYATIDNYAEWQTLADRAATDYKAGKEAPIILIGHSLGADAVMEMAAYLGRKGVPVALVVPFDGTQSFAASANVARVLNLTQRNYAYMRGGPGFKGTLANVDVSSDHSIDHINIDKSPRLHARVVAEVIAIVGNHDAATAKNGNGANAGTASAPRPHKPSGTHAEQIHKRRIDSLTPTLTACPPASPAGSVDKTSQRKPPRGSDAAGKLGVL